MMYSLTICALPDVEHLEVVRVLVAAHADDEGGVRASLGAVQPTQLHLALLHALGRVVGNVPHLKEVRHQLLTPMQILESHHLHCFVRGHRDEAVRALRTQDEAVHTVRMRGQRPDWLVLPPHVEEVNVSCGVQLTSLMI